MLIKNEYKPQMLPKQPKGKKPSSSNERMMLVLGGLALAFSALIFRGVYIQTSEHAFLKDQGDRRFVRTLALPASRGTITDRNGATLALSAPTCISIVCGIFIGPVAFTLYWLPAQRYAKSV